ncbi:MAG: hypothetical protein CFK52_13660 [Chloracidobacterium sp. CP2_5A]|nr:MAG: hypothetical protein CFK52_13660 [Chloracidobacterium sp. CP2_5A]
MTDDTPTDLRAALVTLPDVAPPARLQRQIVTALGLESARHKNRRTWRQWLTGHPRLIGYGLGCAAATLLLSGLLARIWPPLRRLTADAIVYVPRQSPHRFVGGLTATATLPCLTSDKGFDSLPASLVDQPDGLLVIAEVSSSGEARCVDVVEPQSDPAFVAAVDRALQRMTFRPATQADGRPVAARIVFYVERIAVRG